MYPGHARHIFECRSLALCIHASGHIPHLHAAPLCVLCQAADETRKVAEVAFISRLNEEDKKLTLQLKLEEGALESIQTGMQRSSAGRSLSTIL